MAAVRRVRAIDAPVNAVVAVPGSKSIANRALVCAALAAGRSRLGNVPDGDDTRALLDCLRGFGVDVEPGDGRVDVTGPPVEGGAGERTVHAGLAGTTSRFVTALAALGDRPTTIDGDPPLRRRPFGPLHDALDQLGVRVVPGESAGHLPVTVHGPPTSGEVVIRGDVSSQFVSALMLIGPLLPGGLRLRLTTELVSRPYVELTAAVMSWFGIDGVEVGDGHVTVPAARYQPADVDIEPDASSASYPLALAAVLGGAVRVDGLGDGALQGDAGFVDLLARMGCSVERTAVSTEARRDPTTQLVGIDVDLSAMSDLVPTVAVVAVFGSTPTTIRGVGFVRGKESDRLGDLVAELVRAGADVHETGDGLVVRPSRHRLRGARLATHHDHRLAMAFAVLGSATGDIDVGDPGVVTKSWPGFWEMLDEVGAAADR